MNKEVLKHFADVCEAFKSVDGLFSIDLNGSIHIRLETLENMVNAEEIQLTSRGDGDYPYLASVTIEGIKLYSLVRAKDAVRFPQFSAIKKSRKAELLKELAYLEEDVDLSGGEEIA